MLDNLFTIKTSFIEVYKILLFQRIIFYTS